MLDITLLGTSALFPTPDRALTSVFLSCNGHSILFDCGEGTQSAARKANISLINTDLIALTHYHGDHIFGLPGLLQTMSVMGRTKPLYITGPCGLYSELEPILKLTGKTLYSIELITVPDDGLSLNKIAARWDNAKLIAFDTKHRVNSQGYSFILSRAGKFIPEKAENLKIPKNKWSILQKGKCIEQDGKIIKPETVLDNPRKGLKFTFSGDTMYCGGLVKGSENADLLICEATYGENEHINLAREHGHMTFSQAAQTALQAGAKRLWLTHYSQIIRNPEDFLLNAQSIFPPSECGTDGKHIKLEFDKKNKEDV